MIALIDPKTETNEKDEEMKETKSKLSFPSLKKLTGKVNILFMFRGKILTTDLFTEVKF